MFNSYYCNDEQQARPIQELDRCIRNLRKRRTQRCLQRRTQLYRQRMESQKRKGTAGNPDELPHRLPRRNDGELVCQALGTVLANDEVIDGVSERGGFPVVQKKMRQWCLRVSAYAQRLLDGLDTIDWTESLKETQKNWIGRSEGAEVQFKVKTAISNLPSLLPVQIPCSV